MVKLSKTAVVAFGLLSSVSFAKVSLIKETIRTDITYSVNGNSCIKVTDTWDAKPAKNSLEENVRHNSPKSESVPMSDCLYAIKDLTEGCFVVSKADDKMRAAPKTQCNAHVASPDGWEAGPSELKGSWQLKTQFSLPYNPKEGLEKKFGSNKEYNKRFFNDPIVCSMKLTSEPKEPMNLIPRTLFLERVALTRNEDSITYYFEFIPMNPQDATKVDIVNSLTCIVPHKAKLSDDVTLRVDAKVLDREEDLKLILKAVDIELLTPARQEF